MNKRSNEYSPPKLTFTNDEILLVLARYYRKRTITTWVSWDTYMKSAKTNKFPLADEIITRLLNLDSTDELLYTKKSKHSYWSEILELVKVKFEEVQAYLSTEENMTRIFLKDQVQRLVTKKTFLPYQYLFKHSRGTFNRYVAETEEKEQVKLRSAEALILIYGTWNNVRTELLSDDLNPTQAEPSNDSYTTKELLVMLQELSKTYKTFNEINRAISIFRLPSLSTFHTRLGALTFRNCLTAVKKEEVDALIGTEQLPISVEVKRLYELNYKQVDIANQLGISKSRVSQIIKTIRT